MSNSEFSLEEAFSRNKGLISEAEQVELLNKRVVIAGCGGVGGFHAQTLARLGVGCFRITDPDEFSIGNFNRQIGANIHTVNRNKAEVTAEIIHSINPGASVEIVAGGINASNVRDFVGDADLVVDGVDFFSLGVRRELFKAAREAGLPAITAAPLGFSGALLVFSPGSMSFDEYFAFSDDQTYYDQIINFILGLAPSALHIPYMDLSGVDPSTGRGPSSVIGVQLASCLMGAEAVRILLNRNSSHAAPYYLQFDAYRQKFRKGKLRWGNYSILQKVKRYLIVKKFRDLGLDKAFEKLANG